jgi:23S rRNA maturation mini-RNase III
MSLVTDVVDTAVTASPIGAIFTSIKLYATLLIIGAIIAAVFGIRWYLHSEQTKIDTLTEQVTAQQIAITQASAAQALMTSDLAKMKILTDGYNKQIAAIQMNSNKVSTAFNSTQYQNLVKSKPSDAESQINTNINQLFQDVNDASRKPAQ